jgi:hypothetical protein
MSSVVRERLDRRSAETWDVEALGLHFRASVGRYDDGWPPQGRGVGRPQKRTPPSASTEIIKAKTIWTTWPVLGTGARRKASRKRLYRPPKRPDWHRKAGEADLNAIEAQKALCHSVPQLAPANPSPAAGIHEPTAS